MHSRLALLIAASMLALASPMAAQAQSSPQTQSQTVTTVTLEQVAAVLRAAGYRAEISNDNKTPKVRTGLGGYQVNIYLYACQNSPNCSSLQFYAGFKKEDKFTLRYVNSWNQRKRYAKAYIDKDGDLAFEFDVNLEGGVNQAFLKEQVLLFERLLSELNKFEPS